ncbi:GTP cyclohydrolase I [Jiangella anatolica]|uniref:GTP cyclohydrolase I n=1 Tax=Jiangella anatolica TaxID=2670374 RepID=UPI0018F7BBCA|nr:GTP cyclohydrolase I [Jiangella anatolica]
MTTDPLAFELTTFHNDAGYDELVLVHHITFRSPMFSGVAHVGYLPGERIVGLSKFARVVEHYAGPARLQERLTRQIADLLELRLLPRGVGVVVDAAHPGPGGRPGIRTRTTAMTGSLRTDPAVRAEFFAAVDGRYASSSRRRAR